jgi:nucleoside-diphosphate-sugar epimerase
MRVFVAGGAGVLGRRSVPQLVARRHHVTATTTSAAKLDLLARLGVDGAVMDGLDAVSVGEAVAKARPDAIVHQMTGLSLTHAGKPDLKHFDRWAIPTIRLRTEGTEHLLAATEATGVSHFVAQGYANWNGVREGGWVKMEEDPLDLLEGTPAHTSMAALRHVEEVVGKGGGAIMRYGGFYGPLATDDQVELVRKRQSPLVGSGLATPRGCTWMTRRARLCWLSSSRRGVCSTSSTTNLPRRVSGCPIWRRALGRSDRCGSPSGWPGCSPGRWR